MRGTADLELSANSSMNAQGVEGHMGLAVALGAEGRRGGMVLERGRTPVRVERMQEFLDRYPDRAAARLLGEGFRWGFRIPAEVTAGPVVHKNLRSALEHADVVTEKLNREVALGRMAGPFKVPPLPSLRVSPVGVVPKKEPNKFRLIHHLSFPKGASVNDGIDPELCSVVYTSFDAAVGWVRRCGQGALLAKVDVEAAFRLLPVHVESMGLLGCYWGGEYFVDRCLPMGCSLSCAYFEAFSSFLEWVVVEVSGCASVIHYLDDFLCLGPANSRVCSLLLHTVQSVFARFGVPLAVEKTVGPVTELCFLGIVIDTVRMECRLPADKLLDLRREISQAIGREKIRLRELQSLLGKLNFACQIMPMGRIFCRRLAAATAGVSAPYHFIRLRKELKGDLRVWAEFLERYNGRTLIMGEVCDCADFELYTDASGGVGFGAYCQGQWCAGGWPESWVERGWVSNIALLELFPIVMAVVLWGDRFANRKVRFNCDNLGVVQAINSLSASSPPVVRLLQFLVLQCLSINVWVVARHVAGVTNSVADSLSRLQWDRFRLLVPEAELEGLECPSWLWGILEER
ncbi:uncharacterized protein LOC122921997 isoform X1 [Bufo gargarizans]|uniref:uncharacterized protein LOC122921997 isoform X1 n=1 Tax=Bufo gargarizans TaxID=30331 RepID=UPI001CF1CD77|nr:uncharacterized protein LOC122921997 isoform X1 [Bufo gargarizans]